MRYNIYVCGQIYFPRRLRAHVLPFRVCIYMCACAIFPVGLLINSRFASIFTYASVLIELCVFPYAHIQFPPRGATHSSAILSICIYISASILLCVFACVHIQFAPHGATHFLASPRVIISFCLYRSLLHTHTHPWTLE